MIFHRVPGSLISVEAVYRARQPSGVARLARWLRGHGVPVEIAPGPPETYGQRMRQAVFEACAAHRACGNCDNE